jgi:hypothetical protein
MMFKFNLSVRAKIIIDSDILEEEAFNPLKPKLI